MLPRDSDPYYPKRNASPTHFRYSNYTLITDAYECLRQFCLALPTRDIDS